MPKMRHFRCRVCDRPTIDKGRCPDCTDLGYYAPPPEEIDRLRAEILSRNYPGIEVPPYRRDPSEELEAIHPPAGG